MINFRTIKSLHPALLVVPFYASLLISADSQVSRGLFNLAAFYTIFWLWKNRASFSSKFNLSSLIGVIFIAYIAASSLWGESSDINTYLRWGAGLSVFWITLTILAQASEKHLYETALLLIFCTCIAALYSSINYFVSSDAPLRNMGPGMIRHPILGPSVLISVGATSVMLLQYCKRFPLALISVLFASLLIYTLTTASRGPLLSLGVWGLALALVSPVPLYVKKVAITLGILFLLGLYLALPEFVLSLIERGSTYRIDIWKTVIPTLQDNFFFGHGVSLDFVTTETSRKLEEITGLAIEHPHNLGLSTWLYSGLVGVMLLATTTLSGIAILYKKNTTSLFYCFPLMCAVFFLSLTDLSKLVSPPSAIWFIFWLPFAILSGLSTREDEDDSNVTSLHSSP